MYINSLTKGVSTVSGLNQLVRLIEKTIEKNLLGKGLVL